MLPHEFDDIYEDAGDAIDREYEDYFDLLGDGDGLRLCEVCEDRYAYQSDICTECSRQRMIDQS